MRSILAEDNDSKKTIIANFGERRRSNRLLCISRKSCPGTSKKDPIVIDEEDSEKEYSRAEDNDSEKTIIVNFGERRRSNRLLCISHKSAPETSKKDPIIIDENDSEKDYSSAEDNDSEKTIIANFGERRRSNRLLCISRKSGPGTSKKDPIVIDEEDSEKDYSSAEDNDSEKTIAQGGSQTDWISNLISSEVSSLEKISKSSSKMETKLIGYDATHLVMDQLCHTCGAIGYAELVATCSKCKVVRAHLYCMRIKLDAVPDFWLCEYCGLDDAKNPVDLGWKVKPKKGWIVKSRIPRHTNVCKVKYLFTEEIIKLSSGGMNGSPKLNMASTPKMTSISRKTTLSSMPRPLVQASKESQERSYGMMPPKDLGGKKQKLAACLPPIAKQTNKKAKVANILACASPVVKPASPVMNSGVEDSSMKEVDIDCSYLPALSASWKGGFRFVNSLVAGVEFYGGFLAKPPCTVNRKAYEFSQKMPPVLQVKLQARSDIWDDLFDLDFLTLGDIALYFFPSENMERSSENNSSLFELMVRENLLIRSFIDGVELIIFTSKQLDADSQYVINCLNSQCHLFGIFRNIENNPSPSDILGEHLTAPSVQHALTVPLVKSAAIVPQLECTFNGNDNCDNDKVLDMEIDMMGGHDIGKPTLPLKDLDSTIERLLLEFRPRARESMMGEHDIGKPTIPLKDLDSTIERLLLEFRPRARESDVDTFPKHDDQEPVPISAIGPDSLLLSNVKTEEEVIDNKRWLKTDNSSRVIPTFSLDGSRQISPNLQSRD